MFFYISIAAFLSAVCAAYILMFSSSVLVMCVTLFMLPLFLFQYNKKIIICCILATVFFIAGLLRVVLAENTMPTVDSKILEVYAEYEGRVIAEPDVREKVTHYVVQLDDVKGKVRVTRGHYPPLRYGDTVQFNGKLELPENFRGETGIEFDYVHFLKKEQILYVMTFPHIAVHVPAEHASLTSILFRLKAWFVEKLNRSHPPAQAALAAGILLGVKQSLGPVLLKAFQDVGLIHIVVLSGYNVTIIAETIRRVLSFFPRTFAIGGSIFSIICFALITGASATTVRASIMALIVVLAWSLRTTYSVHRALWVAAFLMVLHNPMIVVYDPGFQLSFVATLGLLHVSPLISRVLERLHIPERFALRETLSATLATQLSVLPLRVSMMGKVSLISLLANVLVIPMVPFAMLVSALAGLTELLGFAGLPFAVLSTLTLKYITTTALLLSKVPYATITL